MIRYSTINKKEILQKLFIIDTQEAQQEETTKWSLQSQETKELVLPLIQSILKSWKNGIVS